MTTTAGTILLSDCLLRGGSKGEQRRHVPQKLQVFFKNIILHRRVLFYKFTDITVMFLSRESLY